MRFCMVTTFYPPYHFGGDALYVRALSRALVARGHEVEVVHCLDAYRIAKGPPVEDPVDDDDGISVLRLKSRAGLLSPLLSHQTGRPGLKARAERRLLERPFDVVNFHNISLMGGPGVIRYSRAPVTLYTLHEHWLLCPTHVFWKNKSRPCDRPTCFTCSIRSGIPPQLWRYTGLAKAAVAEADALIAPSGFTAELHRAAGYAPPIHVLPLFSEIEPDDADVGHEPPRRPRFLYVGRLTASKGIVQLLEDFARLPDYDLWVIGDGELRDKLQRAYGRHPAIRFLGRVPQGELIAHYKAATALVFPSLAVETFGLSIVEAFACGTPAVVRDAGGAREIVDATGAGFVYRDSGELIAALRRLTGDRALRRKLGELARQSFLSYYTRATHVDAYLECIRAIQASKGTGRD